MAGSLRRTTRVVRPWRAPIAATLALGLVSGCTGGGCSAVGCAPSVWLDPTGFTESTGTLPTDFRLCVGATCSQAHWTESNPQAVQLTLPEVTSVAPITVTIRAKVQGHQARTHSLMVTPRRSAPNGEQCGPICYTSSIVYRDGQFVQEQPVTPEQPRKPSGTTTG